MNNRYLFSIILVVFIDLLGFSLIIPLLPYYAQTFQASDTTIGLLLASYWAPGLFGALILFVTFAYVLRTVGNDREMISIAR